MSLTGQFVTLLGVFALALASSPPANVPFRDELRVMVFGIAVLGTVVRGLLTPFVLRRA